jgi:hypothetical protein
LATSLATQQATLAALPVDQPTAGGIGQPATPGTATPGAASPGVASPGAAATEAAATEAVTPGAAATGAKAAEARLAPFTAHKPAPGEPSPAPTTLGTASEATAVGVKPGIAIPVAAEPSIVPIASPASVDPSVLAPAIAPGAATPVQHGQTTAPAAPQGDAGAAPSPAAQVAPALLSLAQAPSGGSRLTLRLDPAELGHVQIRIDRAQDAPARVEITAERPETLALLQRDQPQLQRALDQAGVPADGRSLTFHVANQQTGGGQSWSGAGTSGQSGGGSQNWTGASQQSGEEDAATGQPPTTARWLRAGLDITA